MISFCSATEAVSLAFSQYAMLISFNMVAMDKDLNSATMLYIEKTTAVLNYSVQNNIKIQEVRKSGNYQMDMIVSFGTIGEVQKFKKAVEEILKK